MLGGRLSALEGVRPEDLTIDSSSAASRKGGIDEVVLAMNATLEGQTTAHYLAERLEGFPFGSASWRTDFPSVANSTISTKARSPRPCGRAAHRLNRLA